MKKRLYPLLLLCFLLLCLGLTACGGNKSLSGEVVAVQQDPAALVLQKTDGKRIAVLLEEDTYISGGDGFDGEAYRAAPHTGVTVYFFPKGLRTSLTTAEGEKLKAYRADRYISIDSYLVEDAYTLSDGTPLDAWEGRFDGTRYQLKNGAELLREDRLSGPENVYVGGLESYDSLSPAAQAAVAKFYADQGKLYDLDDMLEQAYAAYQEDPESFCAYYVSQQTSPDASSRQVMYFSTCLTVSVSLTSGSATGYVQTQDLSIQTAFDRETGEVIPTADLFTCPDLEIGKRLLDLAAEDGWPDTPALKQEMLTAFRLEYVTISSHGLYISFPQGSLPSQEYAYVLSVDYNDGLRALLYPWAVPTASET